MDLLVLKDQIMKNQIQHFYIFTGIEIGIQHIYLNQMSKVIGMPIIREDSVLVAYKKCTAKTLFGNTKGFYVVRGDTEFIKQEKFYENIKSEIGENFIVLLYEKIDSRLKFGKFFSDCTVSFEKLATNVLISYIKKQKLSSKYAEELSSNVSGSYDLSMLECEKITSYAQARKITMNEAYKKLVDSGVMYHEQEVDVFKFTDAFMNRDTRTACEILNELDNNGIQHINILGTLYNSMKTVMLIQCCSGDICNTTGLDNKQVYFNKRYVGNYDTIELVDGVKLIARIIDDIKNGRIDDKISVHYIMVKIM